MTLNYTRCFLRSTKNPNKIINLPHDENKIIGRSHETGITDPFVSREHMWCYADLHGGKVSLKTIGKSYSGCNGYALVKNHMYKLTEGARVEIRLGFHEFEICFEPENRDEGARTNDKRVLDQISAEGEGDEPETKKIKLDSAPGGVTNGKWECIDGKELLIFTSDQCAPREAIASFDLDGTLIKTRTGGQFPKDWDDWTINLSEIPKSLKKLYDTNYKIVIFTNQSRIGEQSSNIKNFKLKIENIIEKLGVPMQVYTATGRAIYRKPAPGMWDHLEKYGNGTVKIDKSKSFYVGDAAGRKKNWALNKKKDHSISDRLFAINIGLQFYTPEEYFLMGGKSRNPYTMPEFDPRKIDSGDYPEIDSKTQEVIVMVGSPASGKSHYCQEQLIAKGYQVVSRDILKDWQTCVKTLEKCLQNKQSVVIDNTNPDLESRKRYIDVAKKYGVNCRCFVMATGFKHIKHNNRFRELTDKKHALVKDVILNTFRKNFLEPKVEEGFKEIVKIPFKPKFDKAEHEQLYTQFLLES